MSAAGDGGGKPPGDDPLWRAITQTTRPLAKRRREARHTGQATPAPAQPRAARKPKPQYPAPLPAKPAPPGPAASPPPLRRLDPKLSQRLARGRSAYDARIDLHGMRRAEARAALLAFLIRARDDGGRLVLVITGKGRTADPEGVRTPAESGVLRRELPRWLALPDFRDLVVGVAPAHRRHGGEGAFYIHLRRKR